MYLYFILFYLVANACSGTHASAPPGASLLQQARSDAATYTPSSGGSTGQAYTLTCAAGYYAEQENGVLLCDKQGVWMEKPTCLRECVHLSHSELKCDVLN